jgi:hypothetical protein
VDENLWRLLRRCARAWNAFRRLNQEAARLSAQCQQNNAERAAAEADLWTAMGELCDYAEKADEAD